MFVTPCDAVVVYSTGYDNDDVGGREHARAGQGAADTVLILVGLSMIGARRAHPDMDTTAGGSLLPPATMPIHVETKHIAPTDPTLPALALQATHLIDSYMVWIGFTDVPEENVQLAPLRGSLVKDWACAMPPSSVRRLGSDNEHCA